VKIRPKVFEFTRRRLAYLRGAEIVSVAQQVRLTSVAANTLLNQARRQVIPAFRERGVWKMPTD
jgi:hypothetical protein